MKGVECLDNKRQREYSFVIIRKSYSMRCFQMKIGIIGGGSIGLLLSSYLCDQHNVTLYVRRQEQKKVLNEKGLFLSDMDAPFSIHTLLLNEIEEADCFIVCVKQHQLIEILPYLKKVNNRVPLLFLQNGMGHLEKIRDLQNDLYVGVVEHGALKEFDNHVNHTGKGKIKIAVYRGNSETVATLTKKLNQTLFPVEASTDWKELLTKKLIVNAVINPITTIFNVPNKEILTNSYIYNLAEKLCYEAAMVLHLDYNTQLERVKKIAHQTGENISSMLTDIKKGRQTEIDAISGYLIQKSNCEIPYTFFVYNSVKAIEFMNGIGKING